MKRFCCSATVLPVSLAALWVFGIGSAAAGLGQEKPDIVTLMPAPEWRLTASRSTDTSALSRWKGDPAIEHEYGVTAFTARIYQFENHQADVLIEQTADTSAAYGLFTFYRTAQMAIVAPLTVSAGAETLMVRGPAFIRCFVGTRDTLPERDYRALLITVGGPPPSARSLEQLPAPLPSRGLIHGSEKYLLGPLALAHALPSFPSTVVGFDSGAEVQSGEYALGPDKLTLMTINYPTPQIARAAFDSIKGKLGAGLANAVVEVRREDTYVLVTLNATSQAAADRFLDQFKVSKTISQDQVTSEHTEAVQLVNLLFANAVIILGLAGVSVVGGCMVFASKRLARKWFPGSVFVEGENGGFTILNLRWTK